MASLSSLLSLSPYSQCKPQSSIPSKYKALSINMSHAKPQKEKNHQNPQAQGDSQIKFDRRDVLFGLGGLYGVTTLGSNKFALAADDDLSLSPDVQNCGPADTPVGPMDCCPPKINKIIDFTKPINPKLHVRPAVQLLTPKQLADFERGIEIMKNLKPDDPRNFYQQAKIHCAYCDSAYKQIGSEQTDFLFISMPYSSHFTVLTFTTLKESYAILLVTLILPYPFGIGMHPLACTCLYITTATQIHHFTMRIVTPYTKHQKFLILTMTDQPKTLLMMWWIAISVG